MASETKTSDAVANDSLEGPPVSAPHPFLRDQEIVTELMVAGVIGPPVPHPSEEDRQWVLAIPR